MAAAATDATAKTVARLAPSNALGNNSKNATYSMAPDANPKPSGNMGRNACAAMNAGTAKSGCVMLENTDHMLASNRPTPRGTNTRQMAKPSGTLWTASAEEMNIPNCDPLSPAKETPMPMPSAKECTIMTTTINNILFASEPEKPLNFRCSYFSIACARPMVKRTPATAPTRARKRAVRMLCVWCPSRVCIASNRRPTLAAAIMPLASALHAPSHTVLTSRKAAKGSTPKPVDTAVIHPALHTARREGTLGRPDTSCCSTAVPPNRSYIATIVIVADMAQAMRATWKLMIPPSV